jgi:hypothetical protein
VVLIFAWSAMCAPRGETRLTFRSVSETNDRRMAGRAVASLDS